jgi:hypothetical protein
LDGRDSAGEVREKMNISEAEESWVAPLSLLSEATKLRSSEACVLPLAFSVDVALAES